MTSQPLQSPESLLKSRLGAPEIIVTDQDRQFKIYQDYGVEHHRTSEYQPQRNVKVKTIKKTMSHSTKGHHKWIELLSTILRGLRNAFNSDSNDSRAQIIFGGDAKIPGELLSSEVNLQSTQRQCLQQIQHNNTLRRENI